MGSSVPHPASFVHSGAVDQAQPWPVRRRLWYPISPPFSSRSDVNVGTGECFRSSRFILRMYICRTTNGALDVPWLGFSVSISHGIGRRLRSEHHGNDAMLCFRAPLACARENHTPALDDCKCLSGLEVASLRLVENKVLRFRDEVIYS